MAASNDRMIFDLEDSARAIPALDCGHATTRADTSKNYLRRAEGGEESVWPMADVVRQDTIVTTMRAMGIALVDQPSGRIRLSPDTDEPPEVVGEFGHVDLRVGTGDADGAREEAEDMLLGGEDGLDRGTYF